MSGNFEKRLKLAAQIEREQDAMIDRMTPCPLPERGTIGAETHCFHYFDYHDIPCCWCGTVEDEGDHPRCGGGNDG